MLSIESLKEYGADVDAALGRCLNNKDFYLKLVMMIKDESNFDVLKEALSQKDYTKAFEAAHALKGVVTNLSLGPLEKAVVEITELLRHREDVDYKPYLDKVLEERDNLFNLIDN